ncbi:acyl-CoA dehydrogenase, partial [Pseudomonas syringae pv. actinidiae]|nr:acyl-CoA dehydrogenase [Pseudomonas syringae pv. actinidiae]
MTLSTLRPTPRQQSESPESAEDFTQRLADLTRTLAETAEQYDISAQFPHANFRLL